MIELEPASASARVRGSACRVAVALAAALAAASQGCVLDADLGGWVADAEAPTGGDAASDAAVDASAPELDADPLADAACASEAGACSAGDGGSDGWTLKVSLGLTTSYFADGRSLPAGDYALVYVTGCWKSGVVAWTVNLGGDGYWLVGGDPEQRLGMAPGTVGTFAGLGAYGMYEECVAANTGRPGFYFHHQGGPLGLKLESIDPLTRFILLEGGESVGGHSPTFRLTCAGDCR